MKLVYVAGPFRSMNQNGKSNAWGVQSNIMAAMKLALEVWKLGHAALCPHANTMFFQDADGCADEVWLEGDLEMLKRCDAVLVTPDWQRSSGARKEVLEACEAGIPVFQTLEALKVWLNTPFESVPE
jgi:hypothetical protein